MCTNDIVCNYILELTRVVLLLNISLPSIHSQLLSLFAARRTGSVRADVASMTQTVRLSSANTLDEVQVVKHLAIVAVAEDSK